MVIAGSASFPLWMIPCGMGVYVMGITLFARDEADVGRRLPTVCGCTYYVRLGFLLLVWHHWSVWKWRPCQRPALACRRPAYCMACTVGCARWFQSSSVASKLLSIRCRNACKSAVGNAIMSLITLDAVLVLAFCGEQWAVSVLALLVWFVLGRRIAAVT